MPAMPGWVHKVRDVTLDTLAGAVLGAGTLLVVGTLPVMFLSAVREGDFVPHVGWKVFWAEQLTLAAPGAGLGAAVGLAAGLLWHLWFPTRGQALDMERRLGRTVLLGAALGMGLVLILILAEPLWVSHESQMGGYVSPRRFPGHTLLFWGGLGALFGAWTALLIGLWHVVAASRRRCA